MNYQCPLCQSNLAEIWRVSFRELQQESFATYNAKVDKLYCFNHENDVWFSLIINNKHITRMCLQYPDKDFPGEAIRVIYWVLLGNTCITDRFENALIPMIKFKPDFSNLEKLKNKIKTCLVFS